VWTCSSTDAAAAAAAVAAAAVVVLQVLVTRGGRCQATGSQGSGQVRSIRVLRQCYSQGAVALRHWLSGLGGSGVVRFPPLFDSTVVEQVDTQGSKSGCYQGGATGFTTAQRGTWSCNTTAAVQKHPWPRFQLSSAPAALPPHLVLLIPYSLPTHSCCAAGGRGAGLDRDERYGERPERGVGPRDEGGFGPRCVVGGWNFCEDESSGGQDTVVHAQKKGRGAERGLLWAQVW
jgi:hypothetical protein